MYGPNNQFLKICYCIISCYGVVPNLTQGTNTETDELPKKLMNGTLSQNSKCCDYILSKQLNILRNKNC